MELDDSTRTEDHILPEDGHDPHQALPFLFLPLQR